MAEVTDYLKYKLVLDDLKENLRPLTWGSITVWRIDWVVFPFWEQVLAVELKKMAREWNVQLTLNATEVQADTGRCLVSIAFHWELPFVESTAMDKV